MLHISELSDDKVENPEELVKVGDDIEVKVLRVDAKERKIGLSRKNLHGGVPDEEPVETPPAETPETAESKAEKAEKAEKPRELRGGTGAAGPLFSLPGQEEKK